MELMKTTLTRSILLSIIFLLGATGCSPMSEEIMQTPVKSTNDNSNIKHQANTWQKVTVNYYNFEGGFYGLVTSTGIKLLPMNLAPKYEVPGTVLKIKGEMIKDMITIQQWGQPYKVSDVELITLGKVDDPNTF
jgi:hypothetical protein